MHEWARVLFSIIVSLETHRSRQSTKVILIISIEYNVFTRKIITIDNLIHLLSIFYWNWWISQAFWMATPTMKASNCHRLETHENRQSTKVILIIWIELNSFTRKVNKLVNLINSLYAFYQNQLFLVHELSIILWSSGTTVWFQNPSAFLW